jgi:hypothetical protein
MADNDLSLNFTPFLRQGLAAFPSREEGARWAQKKIALRVLKGGVVLKQSETRAYNVRGPGDVVGIDSSAIARRVPSPGDPDWQANDFPFVEFKDPDLPWRYSVDQVADRRLAPWIVLLVVPREKVSITAFSPDGEHNAMKVAFPVDQIPDLANLWAWAHVQGLAQGGKPLKVQPGLRCSRLLCPIQLQVGTMYTAMVAPATQAGRLASLGQTVQAQDLRVWTAADAKDGVLELPVYFYWQFRTGPKGDFETLLRRVLDRMKRTPLPDASALGVRDVDGREPGIFAQQWNPQQDSFKVTGALLPFNIGKPAPNEDDVQFAGLLRAELKREIGSEMSEGDPLVGLPSYGDRWVADPASSVQPITSEPSTWFTWLNLLRRNRVAASLGTGAIRRDQETLVAECWRQAGEVQRANEEVHTARIGVFLGTRLRQKHVDPLTYERALFITEPAHHLTGTTGKTYKAIYNNTAVGTALAAGYHRIMVQRIGYDDAAVKKDDGARFQRSSFLSFVKTRVDPPRDPPMRVRSKVFATPLRPDLIDVAPAPLDGNFTALFSPQADVLGRIRSMITVSGQRPADLKSVGFLPMIVRPTYEYIVQKGPDFLIPNLSGLENNATVLLVENDEFIHCYMAALNDEMNRELLWREFPLPIQPPATILRHFWQSLGPDPSNDGEISDMAQWNQHGIEDAALAGPGAQQERIVFGMKADLVRRYPDFLLHLVRLNKAAGEGAERLDELLEAIARDSPSDDVFGPVFTAKVGTSTVLYGFNHTRDQLRDLSYRYLFVISQPHSLPLFGLDEVGDLETERVLVSDFSWSQPKILAGNWISPLQLEKGTVVDEDGNSLWTAQNTSARIARCLYQQPFQGVIDAATLISL